MRSRHTGRRYYYYQPGGSGLARAANLGGGGANRIPNSTYAGAVAGSPGTVPTGWTVAVPTGLVRTIALTTAVDDLGATIDVIDFNYVGVTASTAPITCLMGPTTGIAALTGQTWVESAWVSTPVDHAALTALQLSITERTSGGALVGNRAALNYYANRLVFARRQGAVTLSGGGTTANVQGRIDSNSIASGTDMTAGLTIRIGWPQLEPGAVATTFKPTP